MKLILTSFASAGTARLATSLHNNSIRRMSVRRRIHCTLAYKHEHQIPHAMQISLSLAFIPILILLLFFLYGGGANGLLSKSKLQSNEPMFFLAWRLYEQITRSCKNMLPNASLYTDLVFLEAYCFELMLVIILAAMPLTLDRQACQVRNGTGDQGPKSHH